MDISTFPTIDAVQVETTEFQKLVIVVIIGHGFHHFGTLLSYTLHCTVSERNAMDETDAKTQRQIENGGGRQTNKEKQRESKRVKKRA